MSAAAAVEDDDEVVREDGCRLTCGQEAREEFWEEVETFYREGLFCDLHLMCGDGKVVACHRVVLAAVSPVLARSLRGTASAEEERAATASVPDHNHDDVRRFVDALYGFLGRSAEEQELSEAPQEVRDTLRVDLAALSTLRPTTGLVKVEGQEEGEEDEEEDEGYCVKQEMPVDVQIRERPARLKREAAAIGWSDEGEEGEEEDGDWFEQEKRRRRRRKMKREAKEEEVEEEYWDEDEREEYTITPKGGSRSARGGRREGAGGRKGRKKREPTMVERTFTPRKGRNGEAVKSPEELYAQMTGCDGEVTVAMQDEPLNVPQHIRAKYRVRTIYQAMIGLRRAQGEVESSVYEAMPLAWSILGETEDVAEQYKMTMRAFIAVLGFSDMEAYYDAQVYSRQGIFRQNNNHKTRYALRKEYMKSSREELEALLRRDDVVAATQRRTPKPSFPIRSETATLVMNKDLSPEQLDGLAFVAFFDDGGVSGWVLKVNEARRQEDTADCVKAAFEIWSRLKKDPKSKYFFMPRSPEMCRIYDRYIAPCETYVVAQEFLRDVDGKRRERLLTKEKQCHECGLVFALTNINEEQKFINHKRMHYIKNFQCGCEVTFKNYPEKKTHFQLFHSDGKFIKCDSCSFIANPAAVRRHHEKWHADGATREYVCPTCGITAKNKHGYYFHMMTHKEYTCDACGESVTGHKKLLQHKRRAHPQKPEEHPCGQCGKVYASERKLREHNFRMHVPDKERPYPCPDCDRGFARSLELSQHRMQAHIRSRPYACRYGCGVAYNDYSSRGVHERKKHGAIFTAAVNTLQAMDAEAAAAAATAAAGEVANAAQQPPQQQQQPPQQQHQQLQLPAQHHQQALPLQHPQTVPPPPQ